MHNEEDKQRLLAHGDRIRASGALGKSQQLNRLFDLLLERSLADEAPKEVEIAQVVFGKPTDVDLASDATVRVHVHRLRKKLEELPADAHGERVMLPRGQYRLMVVTTAQAPDPEAAADPTAPAAPTSPVTAAKLPRWPWAAGIAAAVIALNLLAWLAWARPQAPDPRLASNLWRDLSARSGPALIVLGDHYVYGEEDGQGNLARMIADPAVRSSETLAHLRQRTPDGDTKYVDINVRLLPEGLAPALGTITPLVLEARGGGRGTLRSITMSRFTNDMLRGSDIVYLGLLGDLGDLEEPLSDLSGLTLAAQDDTIVDRASGQRYVSDWADPSAERIIRRDYAYLASLPGPSGNRIVVIAGLYDPALMEALQIASDPAALELLSARLGSADAFEALYEVRTFGPSNASGKLVLARPLDVSKMWRARGRMPTPPAAASGVKGPP